MAKVTRIKASDKEAEREVSTSKPAKTKGKKKEKKPFILIRPFVALFRYLRDAWHELRQVRWPNRKATWKMVLAVLVYTAIFMVFISLLDLLFSWLFNTILTK
ncbi:preprotein translocase subunit SecE [Candidatus Saccharibacteria bacterium]|nr:preprotein translocase subunit SecE [Candidatus Saccharibacteria bacterium]